MKHAMLLAVRFQDVENRIQQISSNISNIVNKLLYVIGMKLRVKVLVKCN
jgi:hypothetical protein